MRWTRRPAVTSFDDDELAFFHVHRVLSMRRFVDFLQNFERAKPRVLRPDDLAADALHRADIGKRFGRDDVARRENRDARRVE